MFYILDEDPKILQWISPLKKFEVSRIELSSVKKIKDLPSFPLPKLDEEDEEMVLTIEHGDNKELVLIFEDRGKKELWWQGIEHFIKLARGKEGNE
jgi:hypothetical protein